MATQLRIAFIKDWHDDAESIASNKDGILAAFDVLAQRYHVDFFSHHNWEGKPPQSGYDVIICWGSLDRPWHNELPKDIPALLCFAGGPTVHPYLHNFDHIFVESEVYEKAFNNHIIGVSRAFGTNTKIFQYESKTPKVFDAIYPASFCHHKNHEVFARAFGNRGLCVGQFNEPDIVGKCLQLGTPVLRRVSSASLCNLYNMSRVTVIPCGPQGGSQRTVLESMACGTPVVLANDNDRCAEFVQESGFGKLVPPIPEAMREAVDYLISNPLDPQVGVDYIRSKWTEHHYADALEKGIKQCLNR